MTVNELNLTAGTAAEDRANAWRHWLWLVTAATDGLVVITIVGLVSLAYHLQAYGAVPADQVTLELATMLAAIFVFINAMRGRYQFANYLSTKGQIASAFSVWNMTMVAFIAILFLAKIADHYSRAVILASYLVGIPVIALARAAMVRTISIASKTGRITSERVFLIGREVDVMSFVARHQPWNVGFAIVDVAFLRSNDARRINDPAAALAADLVSAVGNCRMKRPDSVFIALPWSDQETIDACVDAFMNLPVAIHLTPEKIMDRFETPHIVRTGGLSSLRLTRPPLSLAEIGLKRAFDIVAAWLILILTAPLLLIIAAAIRLDSPGPVLFRQRRYGFNQQAFRIFKFRTMTTTDDGNVVCGQMSLVGPRPHALAHDQEFERKIALYARRHNVRPGITGWAQVNGLRGETDTHEKMARRIAFDHWYIDNWSIWLDIAILFRTVLSKKALLNAC
jgi:lipopolysaccharide/colanic/teichoic acid biosynthesis glycosyltransferase